MQMTVTFLRSRYKRNFYNDNLEYWFEFSVVDSLLIGTPREIGSTHNVEVTITDLLMNKWNLAGAEWSGVTEEMVKVAFQSAEEYISEQLKKGPLSEKELPSLFMSTKDFPSSCPYNIANIHYPEKTTFEVTIDDKIDQPHELDQARDFLRPESQESSSLVNSVLLVTVNAIETRAVLDTAEKYCREYAHNITYYDLGTVGGVRLFLVRSGMGAVGPDAATVTISEAISHLKPDAVVATGIAFGVDADRQEIGEILISEQVFPYGPQRVGTTLDDKMQRISRGDRVPSSPRLLDRFKDGEIHWTGPKLRFGLILSGDMLVDNLEVRNELIQRAPEAIGGEMEAAGLYSAANREKVDWIVVKAICDWADGRKAENKESNQELAARNAAEFVFFVIERGGLADWPDTSTSSPAALQAGFGNWIDISDQIVNPGFEDGFLGWEEDPSVINSKHAASKSVDDSTEAHNGTHSRKLFLREGGSWIKQIIKLENPLPVQCQVRLGAYVKMPFPGSSANKRFRLMLTARGGSSGQVYPKHTLRDDALAEWTKITTEINQLNYPIHELEIHASTTQGSGIYNGFDQPVWVDDFTIEYRSPKL